MAKLESNGKCIYCNEMLSKRTISRHLEKHLKEIPPVDKKKSFHLRVEDGPYFLQLLVDGDAQLQDVDRFLRRIWLEMLLRPEPILFGWQLDPEEKMQQLARRVFAPGQKIWYAYDFGTSTELTVKVLSVHPIATKEGVLLLSRNEPFEELCDKCKKEPATQLCTAHWEEDDERFFCETCAEEHEEECEEAEYSMVSVVNSPRMGACAYSGGSIDLERDTFVKQG